MTQPEFEPTAETIDGLLDLAAFVKQWFTPFAVTCACKGAEESCARALNDPRVVTQADTVERIAEHIVKLARSLDEKAREAAKEEQRRVDDEDALDAMTAGLPVTPQCPTCSGSRVQIVDGA